MWDAINGILTSGNATAVLLFLGLVILAAIVLVKTNVIAVKTKHLRIGRLENEREIIRRQVETAHSFVMSIEGKIRTDNTNYDGYFTKYILERVYDKVIEWIMFNHISNSPMYIQDKQDTLCNLVYTFEIKDEFKTPEFKERMNNWTAELIARLVQTRELYGKKEE
ncbi:MAG: hypothetical protein MJ196_06155 [Treponemataceae bacterium]|nr:hypothetical protein [Treponemataceae bacterium]